MTEKRTPPEINERLVHATRTALENTLEAARRADKAQATITLPATAINGLLRDPIDDEFWYRRRQFIVFDARSVLSDANADYRI